MAVNVKVFEAAKTGAADAFTSYILGLEKTALSRDEVLRVDLASSLQLFPSVLIYFS